MRQLRHIILLLCLTTLCPKAVMAQLVPRDIPTIEAYINDHKKQRSLLLARIAPSAQDSMSIAPMIMFRRR